MRPWLLLTSLLYLGASGALRAEEKRYVFEKAEMGVPFKLTFYASSDQAAEEGARFAFRQIEALNHTLSDYEDDSELSLFARTSGSGRAVPLSRDLWRVLERSQLLAEQSGGAFDVTLGPLINLWRRTRRHQELPAPQLLAEMQARVGYRALILEPATHTGKLLKPDMRLDVGGIAKGYAADEAVAALRRFGITRALAAASGDIVAGDPPPGEPGWRVEVAGLDAPGAPPAEVLYLAHAGVSTSGDAYQYVEIAGVRYSHVVDPKTGVGMTDHSLVTVVAPDGLTADGLDTAMDALGPDRGLKLLSQWPGCSARIARAPGGKVEHYESPGWPSLPRPR